MTIIKNTTACIKAFARPSKFEKTLKSAIDAGFEKIEIGYDGPKDLLSFHQDIIKKYDTRIHFQIFPFNMGLAYVRNALVTKADTRYVLLLDDDQYVPSSIAEVLFLFHDYPKIGVISFPWKIITDNLPEYYKKVIAFQNSKRVLEATNIEISDNHFKLITPSTLQYYVKNDYFFIYPFDFVPNSAFFRKNVFKKVLWDSQFKIGGEHQDFFYHLKMKTDYQCAVCLNTFIKHDLGPDSEYYFPFELFRFGKREQKSNDELLNNKLNVKGSIFSYRDIQLFYYYRDKVKINEETKKMIIDGIEVEIKE